MTQRAVWNLVAGFYPGVAGEERQTQWDSRSLISLGWSVQVVTRRHVPYPNMEGLSRTDAVDGIPLTRVYSRGPMKIGGLLYLLNGLLHLILHGRKGVYHARDVGAPGWMAVIAARLLGGRSIVKLNVGSHGYDRRLSSPLSRWHFSRLLRLADKVVVISSELEEYVSRLGIPDERVARIPNGVDVGHFCPASASEKMDMRKSLDLPLDKTLVLFVGRLHTWHKGLDVLIKAWADLPSNVRDQASLLLVGDGNDREEVEGMIRSLRLESSVSLAGIRDNVRDYYRACDLFVLPSRTEGMALVLAEAMACGLPILASKVGGAIDVVEEDSNGVLFESENHAELATKLEEMLRGGDRWPAMGARSRETAKADTNVEVAAPRLVELYRELG